jgi:hypothetical protein
MRQAADRREQRAHRVHATCTSYTAALLVPVAVDRRTAFRGRKAEDAPLLVMLAIPALFVLKFIQDF